MQDNGKKRNFVLIIGCGRSGTHWMANILKGTSEFDVAYERPVLMELAVHVRVTPEQKAVNKIVNVYKKTLANPGKNYVDKAHSLIWIAEELAKKFPEMKFIAIYRNVYGTVASIAKHVGMRAWTKQYAERLKKGTGRENKFFGVDASNKEEYIKASPLARYTYKWVSHMREINRLSSVLRDRVLVVKHDELCKNTDSELARIQQFLGLEKPITGVVVKQKTLKKWKHFPEDKIKEIDAVVDRYPELKSQALP